MLLEWGLYSAVRCVAAAAGSESLQRTVAVRQPARSAQCRGGMCLTLAQAHTGSDSELSPTPFPHLSQAFLGPQFTDNQTLKF